MVVFPRVMISVVGAALIVVLILAGRNFFPAHARLSEAIGLAIGTAINLMLQFALWSSPRV
ncbi:MAG TPA: hypothetical protein VGM26_02280 [Rhizomicrobium sp.]